MHEHNYNIKRSMNEQIIIMGKYNYNLNASVIALCPTSDAGISAVIK